MISGLAMSATISPLAEVLYQKRFSGSDTVDLKLTFYWLVVLTNVVKTAIYFSDVNVCLTDELDAE